MIMIRIESAESGLAKALKWSAAELEKDQVRGNYKSTRARMTKMISDAKQLIKNLEAKLGEHDDSDHTDSDDRGKDDISQIVSQCTTATIKALVDMGVLTTSECRFTPVGTKEAVTESSRTKRKSKDSKSYVSDNVNLESPEEGVVEIIPDAVKRMQKEAKERERKENYVDFKPLMKKYSIAIDNMENYDFKDSATTLCKKYIVRWFNAIKVGFSKGKTRLGANKFAQTIGNIIAVVGTSISSGTLDSFERSFSRWEASVISGTNTYGYPVQVSKFVDQHRTVNGEHRLSEDATCLIESMYSDILKSNTMSSVTKEYDPAYLGSDLIDKIVFACRH